MTLRIAFFGSDVFSVQALSKLLSFRNTNPSLISQVDVITRSMKPQGRKRILNDVPIGKYTNNIINSVPAIALHRADTKEEILQLGKVLSPHLAIAVSYGKLIPPQFISNCKYGGLNVHPSFLPKYSGSSPVQYALMNDDKFTGVTVQTLHPTKFDKGDILAQSPIVSIHESDNYVTLLERLGEHGSDLLVRAIKERLFEPPIAPIVSHYDFSLAPKLSPHISQVDWENHTNRQIKRLNDAFGPLHTYKSSNVKRKKSNDIDKYLKVMFDGINPYSGQLTNQLKSNGSFVFDDSSNKLIVKTADGAISVDKLKMQYCDYEDANKFINHLQKRTGIENEDKFLFCK